MRRKGVEMSLNLIVMIVIALIVAGLLIYLVAKNARNADKDVSSCVAKGGYCSSRGCQAGESGSTFFTGGCRDGEICCTKPLGQG